MDDDAVLGNEPIEEEADEELAEGEIPADFLEDEEPV